MATEIANRIVTAARGWIGTPYRHQASLKGVGCDCLGLLRGVWRELYGAEPEAVPPYAPDWAEGGADTLRNGLARHLDWVAVDAMAPGDVALFRIGRAGRHCGIVGEWGGALTLIHAAQGRRVREEVFSPAWRRRLAFVFRIPS
jgi:NlpC/P60 family putative phage cell wall peptidase